jgi:hypothetical protein
VTVTVRTVKAGGFGLVGKGDDEPHLGLLCAGLFRRLSISYSGKAVGSRAGRKDFLIVRKFGVQPTGQHYEGNQDEGYHAATAPETKRTA